MTTSLRLRYSSFDFFFRRCSAHPFTRCAPCSLPFAGAPYSHGIHFVLFDFQATTLRYLLAGFNATLIVICNCKKQRTKSASHTHTQMNCLFLFIRLWKQNKRREKINLDAMHNNTIYRYIFLKRGFCVLCQRANMKAKKTHTKRTHNPHNKR